VPVDRFQGFVFNAADLSEDVDLDPERRKEILFAQGHVGDFTHWQVLGISWNASAEAAREAYREKVKVFHPDRYPGQRLGSYRARLEQVFRRLTEARDVLSNEAARAAYVRQSAPPDEFARAEAQRLDDEARARERRARLARTNPLVARVSRAHEMVERAKRQMAEGRFAQALNDLSTALAIDPTFPAAKALAQEARKRANVEKAKDCWDKAHSAEAVNNLELALEMAAAAAEGDPSNPRYPVFAARLALRRGARDEARAHAEAALRAAPAHGPAHEVLGEVLVEQGDRAGAKREFERALELDPTLEGARDRLKRLRWSFLG